MVASEVVEVDETEHTTMIPRLGIERTHKDFDKCVFSWAWVLSILTTTCRLPLGTRTHHRVLMFPFADDVTSAKSPLELLHVLCDAVLGLSALPTLVSRRLIDPNSPPAHESGARNALRHLGQQRQALASADRPRSRDAHRPREELRP